MTSSGGRGGEGRLFDPTLDALRCACATHAARLLPIAPGCCPISAPNSAAWDVEQAPSGPIGLLGRTTFVDHFGRTWRRRCRPHIYHSTPRHLRIAWVTGSRRIHGTEEDKS